MVTTGQWSTTAYSGAPGSSGQRSRTNREQQCLSILTCRQCQFCQSRQHDVAVVQSGQHQTTDQPHDRACCGRRNAEAEQVCVQLPASADNVALPAIAAARRAAARLLLSAGQQSIDIFCLPGPLQQTRSAECPGRMGQTDGRTDRQTCGYRT